MKKKIYSYYESFPMRRQEEEFACANIWKGTWEKHGWEAIMLNNSHAKMGSQHQKMISRLFVASKALPAGAQNDFQPIQVKFSRLFALHHAGGGWLSDYDVVNSGFTPQMAEEIEKKCQLFFFDSEKTHLIYVSSAISQAAMQKLMSETLVENEKIRSENEIFSLNTENFESLRNIIHVQANRTEKKSEMMKKIIVS